MKFFFTFLTLSAALLFSTTAQAKIAFGDQDSITKIQDISLKGKNEEELFLGYRTRTKFFGLGVFLSDEGYVFGIKGKSDAYYPMPNEEKVKFLQAANILPIPLPAYKITPAQYLIGYSLYIALFVLAFWVILKSKFSKNKKPQPSAG